MQYSSRSEMKLVITATSFFLIFTITDPSQANQQYAIRATLLLQQIA
jgi:hypothetical protein